MKNLVDVTQEFDNMSVILQNFSEHLKTVHNNETYYGDKTLESLINHMKVVDENINSYTNLLVLFEDDKPIEEEDYEETDPKA